MDAYIYTAIRTPRGAAKKTGGLAHVKPIDLMAVLYQKVEERLGTPISNIEEVVLGYNTQSGEQGANLARVSAVYAGWQHVFGTTLNSFCCSGLDAVSYAAMKAATGSASLIAAGGVESISRVPMFSDNGAWFADQEVAERTRFVHMGIAADLVATLEGFERPALDAYAVESHYRAARATQAGKFARSLIPVTGAAGKTLSHDELIRPDTSVEKLATFAPAFVEVGAQGMDSYVLEKYPQIGSVQHVHHRGNSPSMADGASLLVIGSKAAGEQYGLKPRARIHAAANTACEPVIMLTAAQEATQKAITKAGLRLQDIDRFEFNEGFAAPMLKLLRDLQLDPARVNPNGGALAMGHALAATGGMLLCTLLDELEDHDLHYGVASIMGGAGLGTAVVIERL